MSDALVRARALTKSYATRNGEVRALDAVDFDAPAGTFTCVHGPSGSGKTTLLLALGGMLRPTSGRVHVLERDLYALSRAERAAVRAEQIGFVFQLFHLVPYLDVIENVLLGARRLPRAEGVSAARALLDELGLADRATHRPSELSAGERQRVALGRALVARPSVVLADEPTGNLDPENGAEVLRHLAAFRDRGGTVVVVTHGADADAFADRIVRMRRGGIEEDVRETSGPDDRIAGC